MSISILDKLFAKEYDPMDFHYDMMRIPDLYNYISYDDELMLYNIATSADTMRIKRDAINNIMINRGFKRFASGTNRVVYQYLEDTRFVAKIALDRTGLKDNPAEFKNQIKLKPFVCKIFQVSRTGVIATVERVEPIVNRTQFNNVCNDIFDIIANNFIGKYVMDDIGTKYFMNWGLRKGFGPVLLDYPYLFEIDEAKLYCNKPEPNSPSILCGGLIDYDDGFNHLYCTRCGKRFFAQDIKAENINKLFMIKNEGDDIMKIQLVKNNKVIKTFGENETKTIIDASKIKEPAKKVSIIGIKINNDEEKEEPVESNDISVSVEKQNITNENNLSESDKLVNQQEDSDIDEKDDNLNMSEDSDIDNKDNELDISKDSDEFNDTKNDEAKLEDTNKDYETVVSNLDNYFNTESKFIRDENTDSEVKENYSNNQKIKDNYMSIKDFDDKVFKTKNNNHKKYNKKYTSKEYKNSIYDEY